MPVDYILPFYGYSGSSATIDFKTGQDPNRLFKLAAGTLGRMAKQTSPGATVYPPMKSWTYTAITDAVANLQAVSAARGGQVKEIHICCHGGSAMLSLAYNFDKGERIRRRASHFNMLATPGSDRIAAYTALDDEDALLSGTFSMFTADVPTNKLRKMRTTIFRNMLAKDAYIHLWGCYSGAEWANFTLPPVSQHLRGGRSTDWLPEVQTYLTRFELRKPSPGIARDMAMALGVPVTAARLLEGKSEGGVNFYYRDAKGNVVETQKGTSYSEPIWMWPIKNSRWVTYGPDGNERPTVRVFGLEFRPEDLQGGKPSEWFVKIYK